MKHFVWLGIVFSLCATANSQPASPKLVVGIVVDQMRWDFLYRYEKKYGSGGFKRLLREGYQCQNTHINYSPSITAPGHACIYTGTVPAIHGITGNDWYDYDLGKNLYCSYDSTVNGLGTTAFAGRMSPRNMKVSTVCDELQLANNFRSKVVGIALKDRGAILPAGHTANEAYWFEGSSGNWVSSTYYASELPRWVIEFNNRKLAQQYVKDNWATLLPIAQYEESHADDVDFEAPFSNEERPVFVHKVGDLSTANPGIIRSTPWGNTFTFEFAKAAMQHNSLGADEITDFLAISLSSPDYIGHQFGPNSVEAEDCYLRLDKDMEDFFNHLDSKIGKGNYLLFITADHGAAHVPKFVTGKKLPAGLFQQDTVQKQLQQLLAAKHGEGNWVAAMNNHQLYLNRELAEQRGVDYDDLKDAAASFLKKQEGIARVLDLTNLDREPYEKSMKQMMADGYYPSRSGDLFIQLQPGWISGFSKGTTHSSLWNYDTRIPLVFMGWKVKPATDYSTVHMTDIAPTVAAMLRIQEPNGSIGKVIEGLFK